MASGFGISIVIIERDRKCLPGPSGKLKSYPKIQAEIESANSLKRVECDLGRTEKALRYVAGAHASGCVSL